MCLKLFVSKKPESLMYEYIFGSIHMRQRFHVSANRRLKAHT